LICDDNFWDLGVDFEFKGEIFLVELEFKEVVGVHKKLMEIVFGRFKDEFVVSDMLEIKNRVDEIQQEFTAVFADGEILKEMRFVDFFFEDVDDAKDAV